MTAKKPDEKPAPSIPAVSPGPSDGDVLRAAADILEKRWSGYAANDAIQTLRNAASAIERPAREQ